MRTLISSIFALLLAAAQAAAGSPCHSKAQALEIATDFVKKTTPHLEQWDRPKVDYVPKEHKWMVYWGSKIPGGFISVSVNAKTGDVQMYGST